MSHRHELEAHRHKLTEIRNILYSMKTLALLETHKLERYIQAQSEIAITIDHMAADFLHFYPEVLPQTQPESSLVLLVGSERGFCGNFNQRIAQQLDAFLKDHAIDSTSVIAIGQKLHTLVRDSTCPVIHIKGADVAEDIYRVVTELAQTLSSLRQTPNLYIIHHHHQHTELILKKLLPSFTEQGTASVEFKHPPVLNLHATDFFLELTDHYLYSALHRVLYVSLLSENQSRVEHLEHASRHLDDKTEELQLKINALRQEEIIEEIEVILLNAASR